MGIFKKMKKEKQETTQMDMNAVRANISGRVTEICVSPYQQVKKGDTVIVLEALKMRIPQVAPCDCIVEQILVHVDDTVQEGALLAALQ